MVGMLRDGQVNPTREVYDRLSNCLLCETCSANCPSGIDVHELNAAARSYIYENSPSMSKELIFDTLWTRPGLLKTMTRLMWGAEKSGLKSLARNIGFTKLLPGDLGKSEQIMSNVPYRDARKQIKTVNPAQDKKQYTIGYFLGCGTNLLHPQVAVATVDVLTRNGCEVIVPPDAKCCGLPHVANGKLQTARELAAHNVKIFNSYDFDYIISDCASCSSALKPKNMEFLLGGLKIEDQAKRFADKVMDLSEFLIDVLDVQPLPNSSARKVKVTYHDPCHLANAQKIKAQPRELLQRLPGVELVEMKDANRCCGGSGTYSVTHYDMSMKILDKKWIMPWKPEPKKLPPAAPAA
jgi:glycolate oxidase iron-sulfur subunit